MVTFPFFSSTDTAIDPEAFSETLSSIKQEEPYRNPSPPATPIPHTCPIHPGEPLEARETDTHWGYWHYYRCPVPDCFVRCGDEQIQPYLEAAARQIHDFYRQLPPDKMKCLCTYAPIMSMSHTERNPGRLFLRCKKRQCEFFQWVDEHPREKNYYY